MTTDAERYKDQFQTPKNVAKYMVSLIPEGVKTVLEPTPGLGTIVNELKNYDVTAPADYFLLEKRMWDCVVMNPPFGLKYTFIENAPQEKVISGMKMGYQMLFDCLQMSNHVIALMPWFTISDSDIRLRNLKKYGIKSITALPRKTFQYARIQTVVLEMEKGYLGETKFKVFDFNREPELNLNKV